ncbi:MAG: lmo0937 family membrane protein [Chloroflexi bacterium]|nr:MAG: lmo0937 family membrane protein [Chloroflexota bacterium]
MLWGLIVLLVLLWALGFFTVGSSLVHLLLVVALIVLIYNLIVGRRTVV